MLGLRITCKDCKSVFEIRDPKISEINDLRCPCCKLQFPPETYSALRSISLNYNYILENVNNFNIELFEFEFSPEKTDET